MDLNTDVGSKIICPRDGVVIDCVDQHEKQFIIQVSEDGKISPLESLANSLTILHSDGTVSDYVHLQRHGVLVSIGQFVKVRVFTLTFYQKNLKWIKI